MAEKYFFLDESPFYANKYLIRLDFSKVSFPNGTKGSYMVLPSRLVGLDFPTYLRYVRDVLGAELVGKNTKYITPYFEKTEEVRMFVKLLNARLTYVISEQKTPYEYKEENGTVIRVPFDEVNVCNEKPS